jgi:hypothetical protein
MKRLRWRGGGGKNIGKRGGGQDDGEWDVASTGGKRMNRYLGFRVRV